MIARVMLTMTVLIALHLAAAASNYTDRYFGFRVAVPTGKMVCLPDGTTSNHGYIVLWDTTDCHFIVRPPGIYVYATHNGDEDATTTSDLAKDLCGGNLSGPSPFSVSGFRFSQCRSATREGRPGLEYFVLRHVKGGYPGSEPKYGVSLICPHDDCRSLMPMTRWIFAHMKFIKQVY